MKSTAVEKLGAAISVLIEKKAFDLERIAKGDERKESLTRAEWSDVMRMVKDFPNLDLFEKIVNGESEAILKPVREKKAVVKPEQGDNDEPESEPTTVNVFELKSREFKEKLNGVR